MVQGHLFKPLLMDIVSHHHPMVKFAVAINGWCLSTQNVVVKINDENVKIPLFNYDSLGRNSMSAVMLLAGSEKITIEITGTPGHEVSIKNIQLFQ